MNTLALAVECAVILDRAFADLTSRADFDVGFRFVPPDYIVLTGALGSEPLPV